MKTLEEVFETWEAVIGLEIHAELLSERMEKAIATCRCQVFTAGELAAETEVTIAMR